jgi:hypothetical protein
VNLVLVRSKKPGARSQESPCYLILAQDLGYGQTDPLMNSLEEVSRPLNAYAKAILATGS